MRHRPDPALRFMLFAVAIGLASGCARSFTRGEPEAHIVDDRPYNALDDAGTPAADAGNPDAAGIGPFVAGPPTAAWVTDTRHDRVMLIDLETEQLVGEVSVGGTPRPIAASPDGRTVYVGNNADGTISVIDVASRRVRKTIRVEGRAANAIAIHPSGETLYTATTAGLLEVDLVLGRVSRVLDTFGPSAGIAVSPDGATIFAATDFNSRSLAMVDTSGFFVRHTLDGFTGIGRVSFAPDGELYVADERAGEVVVVDGPLGHVLRRIEVPGAPFAVAVTEEQTMVVGHDQDAPQRMELVGLDGAPQTLETLGSEAGAVPSVMAGTDGRAYATGFLTGELFVLDTRTFRVRKRIPTTGAPFDVALVP